MIKITVNFKRYVITILTFNIYALMVDSGILVGGYVGAWKIKTILVHVELNLTLKKSLQNSKKLGGGCFD